MQFIVKFQMINKFPYQLLSKSEMITQMNHFSSLQIPFLFIVDFKGESGYVIQQNMMDDDFVRFSTYGLDISPPFNSQTKAIAWQITPPTLSKYQEKFDFVVKQIRLGNSFLTNLTQPSFIESNLSLLDFYQRGSAKYKLWLKDQFVVLSPETFIKIDGHKISAYPMKGTIDASILNAKDQILKDPKEKAEHATIVDLIRNDISLVAEEVEVKRYRYVEKLTTNQLDLLQVSSEISGKLPKNFHSRLGDILFTLLPAGSISGAPKPKTLAIIESAEGYDRGFYTGVCGFFDGKNLDSAVMIRFIEQQEKQLIFKSGGGITAQSDLKKEYEELIQKVYVPIS